MMVLALLHPFGQMSWLKWSIHPSTVIGLTALGAIYLWRARHANEGEAVTGARKISFFSALFLIFASLNGPLHDLSDDYLFSAHMVQHLILTLAMPPLLLAGVPGAMLRRPLANHYVAPVARFFTRAPICFVVFNLTIAGWHLPPLYN